MPGCELCGRKEETLSYSYVEGVKLSVCSKCARFGKFAGEIKAQVKVEKFSFEKEIEEEVVVSNFAELIRHKRETLALSQKEFASKLNEKESFVAHMENGKVPLSIEQARKLGKALGLDLISRQKIVHLGKNEKSGSLTIGDLLLKK